MSALHIVALRHARVRTSAVLTSSLVLLLACGGGNESATQSPLGLSETMRALGVDDDNPNAPVDFGYGPGVPAASSKGRQGKLSGDGRVSPAPANGGPNAHIEGAFGPTFTWPLIPLHMVLLPDGRVLSYGTDLTGKQSGLLYYTLWDYRLGAGSESMLTLNQSTGTDLFCNTQTLLPGSGTVMMFGGDRVVNNRRNYANADIDLFDYVSNLMTKKPETMAYRRWYATAVTTANGEQVVLGGRDDNASPNTVATYSPTPEVYSPTLGWRVLTNATSDAAYGVTGTAWYYPRAWQAPNGGIFVLTHGGKTYHLDPSGSGTLTLTGTMKQWGIANLPAVMYAPGKILALRSANIAVVVDINGATPKITETQKVSAFRSWGNATVLPDGKVWVNGGTAVKNELPTAIYHTELWNPQSGAWTTTATAQKPRLYHSASILLPDATVLTGGGGAPGPVNNLNAEVYFPPYLFKTDGSGDFAPRPEIVAAPSHQLTWGEPVHIEVSSNVSVSRVTLLRAGGVTHSFNNEQRFQELAFAQDGASVSFALPSDARIAPPGFYLLFVFDQAGVPSVARILSINQP